MYFDSCTWALLWQKTSEANVQSKNTHQWKICLPVITKLVQITTYSGKENGNRKDEQKELYFLSFFYLLIYFFNFFVCTLTIQGKLGSLIKYFLVLGITDNCSVHCSQVVFKRIQLHLKASETVSVVVQMVFSLNQLGCQWQYQREAQWTQKFLYLLSSPSYSNVTFSPKSEFHVVWNTFEPHIKIENATQWCQCGENGKPMMQKVTVNSSVSWNWDLLNSEH